MTAGVGGVARADARGIFLGDNTGAYTPVARLTEPAGNTGATFSVLKDPVLAEDDGIAFTATLKAPKLKAPATASLWFKPAGESLRLLARGGADADDLPGAKWKAFTSLAIASGRGPIFVATLVPNQTTFTKTSGTGVWACDFLGTPRLLFRTGVPDAIVQNRTLKKFTLLNATVGSPGVARSYNNSAQVVWLAAFADKSQAIVVTDVP